MVMVAVAGLVALIVHDAWPLARLALEPLTTTVAPTSASACVACALCCNVTKMLKESFDFICCSTCANSTSCWVNWLVSMGESGS